LLLPAWLLLIASTARAAGVPNDCQQLIVALAPDWNSMRGTLQRFERDDAGPWRALGAPCEACPPLVRYPLALERLVEEGLNDRLYDDATTLFGRHSFLGST